MRVEQRLLGKGPGAVILLPQPFKLPVGVPTLGVLLIHERTDIRVLLTGEISDELFGYKYTDFAPSPRAFQEEAEKRLRPCSSAQVERA